MKEYSTIIGMDLGDKYSNWALMISDDDEIQEEGRIRTTKTAMARKFKDMEPARIAIEVGTHSRWVCELLEELGHEVLVANARKLRAIYESDSKDDVKDARMLARLARMDPNLLYPIQHRSGQAQADLAVLHARNALVDSRTALINHVRGTVKSFGERLPTCSTVYFHRKVADAIPEALQPALAPLIEMIGELTRRIRAYDEGIEKRCKTGYPETEVLREIKGVGPITALAFVLTIEEPGRFAQSREVGPYLGLIPRKDDSGELNPQLGITKAGDAYLRKLLVGSSQYILGELNNQDSELRQWGIKLAGPKGSNGKRNKKQKKRAVVAVARKLSVLLHRLWVTGEVFDPFNYANQRKSRRHAA